jgi:hypothetical protein
LDAVGEAHGELGHELGLSSHIPVLFHFVLLGTRVVLKHKPRAVNFRCCLLHNITLLIAITYTLKKCLFKKYIYIYKLDINSEIIIHICVYYVLCPFFGDRQCSDSRVGSGYQVLLPMTESVFLSRFRSSSAERGRCRYLERTESLPK